MQNKSGDLGTQLLLRIFDLAVTRNLCGNGLAPSNVPQCETLLELVPHPGLERRPLFAVLQYGLITDLSSLKRFRVCLFLATAGTIIAASQVPCSRCHAKEVSGYERNAMAHSLSLPFPASQPESEFSHVFSGTKFIAKTAPALSQTVARDGLSAEYPIAYVIGSGSHAFAYIVRIGDYLFQSPISYYSRRGIWDVAPGYETNSLPDYDRPVTPECLTCHAGHASPVAGTLNRYESPAFSATAISCDRCHGDPSPHLEHPSRENIINPARLPERARDSVCEQCHLSGEVRILNPKRQFSDFRPGEELEDVFSVYVRRVADSSSPAGSIKVISQAEQLAMSVCARRSAGKLWCGTCHNPHEKPENVAQYYRARCLSCHGEQLVKTHAKPDDDCVSCHMPKRQARDGAHTAFTDHRITRIPVPDNAKSDSFQPASKLAPWHEPAGNLALRNLGLANIEMGERDKSADHLMRERASWLRP